MYCEQPEVGVLVILTYYFEATVTPGGGSVHIFRKVYLSLCLFNYGYKRNYIINLSGTAPVSGAILKIFSLLRNRARFYCFKRFRSESQLPVHDTARDESQ